MSCPTCDHTMHGLGERWFWCPRCGTTLNADDREHTASAPKVTEQLRAFLNSYPYINMAHLREALQFVVRRPEERD